MCERVESGPVLVDYTNWRGERRIRRLILGQVRFGKTQWHPEPTWLLSAYDCDDPAQVWKDFDLLRCNFDVGTTDGDAPGDMHWLADDPEYCLNSWRTAREDCAAAGADVFEVRCARSIPNIFVTTEVTRAAVDGDVIEDRAVWFSTQGEAEGHFERSLDAAVRQAREESDGVEFL